MFNNLADFGFVRTRKEAIGFYLAYFLLILVAAEVVSIGMAFTLNPDSSDAFSFGVGWGAVTACLSCSFLSYRILSDKGLLKVFSSILYIVAAAALGLLGGGLFGMILVSYLTTKNKAEESTAPVPPASDPNLPKN